MGQLIGELLDDLIPSMIIVAMAVAAWFIFTELTYASAYTVKWLLELA